jgi:hypothetical protein
LGSVTSQRDCLTILDVDDDYLFPQREVTLRIGCVTLRSPSLGNSSRYYARWKEPSSNDPFLEADVAVIIMNCFVIAPMLAPPTKGSSETLFHRLRKHPIINTSGNRIVVEVE